MEPDTFIAYGFLPWYPHMSVADTEIWNRYIRANPTAFDSVAYDVAIGQGAAFDTTAGGVLGGNIGRLYQKRVDVIAKKDEWLYLIELKPRASTAAVGQIQAYAAIFERDYPEYKNIKLLIITDSAMPDLDFVAERGGVEVRIA